MPDTPKSFEETFPNGDCRHRNYTVRGDGYGFCDRCGVRCAIPLTPQTAPDLDLLEGLATRREGDEGYLLPIRYRQPLLCLIAAARQAAAPEPPDDFDEAGIRAARPNVSEGGEGGLPEIEGDRRRGIYLFEERFKLNWNAFAYPIGEIRPNGSEYLTAVSEMAQCLYDLRERERQLREERKAHKLAIAQRDEARMTVGEIKRQIDGMDRSINPETDEDTTLERVQYLVGQMVAGNYSIPDMSALEVKITKLEAQRDELREAWRTNVGDGTEKLTAASLASLLEDYRTELADARAQRDEARKDRDFAGEIMGKVCVYGTLISGERPIDPPPHAAIDAILRQINRAEAAEAKLAAMTEDRNLWRDAHNEDCPNLAAATVGKPEELEGLETCARSAELSGNLVYVNPKLILKLLRSLPSEPQIETRKAAENDRTSD